MFNTSPTKQLVLLLALMAGFATGYNFSNQVLMHLVFTVGWALILYWFYSYISSKHKNVWDTVITSLIIFMVLHYGSGFSDLMFPLIAVFLAETQKFFFEFKQSPVVNPAATGMLLTAAFSAIFPSLGTAHVSWWGTSFGFVSMILIWAWILIGLSKWKKFPIFFTFLITHALVMVFRGVDPEYIGVTFADSTIYFLAAVMLVEPKTSPILPRRQIYYGIVAALIYNILAEYGAPHYELFAIIGANIIYYGMKPKLKST